MVQRKSRKFQQKEINPLTDFIQLKITKRFWCALKLAGLWYQIIWCSLVSRYPLGVTTYGSFWDQFICCSLIPRYPLGVATYDSFWDQSICCSLVPRYTLKSFWHQFIWCSLVPRHPLDVATYKSSSGVL